MNQTKAKKLALFGFVAIALAASPAWADSIDGNWCNGHGQHILIKGRYVVTPSGVHMEGEYSRHNFSFVAPPAEPEAGSTILLRLAGEMRMYMTIASKNAEPQVWKRCEEVS